MRRQIRPFVVEVKKKRGNAVWKQSIWGGLDLSVIAAETTEKLQEVEPRQLQENAIEPPALEDVTVSASGTALPTTQVDQDIDGCHTQHAPSDEVNVEEVRPRASRRRREGAETLPRGERWKRRLPAVLRGRK
ncbi:MAG: hypothetical protein F9K19_16950 [Rhizobiaceae bacterium]|nr:MAG: hypothetical protein F9K19_16950 [Rhizobiaceae bacterium]